MTTAFNPYGFNKLRFDGIYSSHYSAGDLPINFLRFKSSGDVYTSVSVNDTASSNRNNCCIAKYILNDDCITLSFVMGVGIPIKMEGKLINNEIHLHVFAEYLNKAGSLVTLNVNKKFKYYCSWS